MAGRVDQVELVRLPVFGGVGQGDGIRLDRDPTLPLEVHGVEDLVAEVAVFHPAAALDEAVGERRLAVVDVGDDAEVADVVHGPLTVVPWMGGRPVSLAGERETDALAPCQ